MIKWVWFPKLLRNEDHAWSLLGDDMHSSAIVLFNNHVLARKWTEMSTLYLSSVGNMGIMSLVQSA